MRIAFNHTLLNAAKENKNILLLTGDVGYSVFEPFIESFPQQYLNAGLSEQNMTGVAAGLAMEGKIPVIYSIIPFVTMRNFEQIRNDICYQNVNVKIVGVASGFSYGAYGHTHHGLEDIGILRTLANLVILSPSDPREVEEATKWALKYKGPVYVRLGKAGEPILHQKPFAFKLGKGLKLKNGTDITIFATGAITKSAMEAATILEGKGISTAVYSMISLKPLDIELILQQAKKTRAIFTLEEHSIIGGLGSGVAEILAENGRSIIFKRIGVPDEFSSFSGRQEFMQKMNHLSVKDIVQLIIRKLHYSP